MDLVGNYEQCSHMCRHMCCSVLQCVAVCCRVLQCVVVCGSVLQGVAVFLQRVAVCCTNPSHGYRPDYVHCSRMCRYTCCSVVAVCCSGLQFVAVCCSVLKCVCSALPLWHVPSVAVCRTNLVHKYRRDYELCSYKCRYMYCSVVATGAVCLQCVAERCSVLPCVVMQCDVVCSCWHIKRSCTATVCCSVLQCVAV